MLNKYEQIPIDIKNFSIMNIETNPAKISSTLFQSNKLKAYITRLKNTRKEAMVQYYKDIGKDDSSLSEIMDSSNKGFIYDILPSGDFLSKSHKNIFVKPDNPCMGGYESITRTPMEHKLDFEDNIEFEVPHVGKAISDCMLLIKISKLRSKRDVRYIDYPGHKILDSVEITIGNYKWKYTPELNNVKSYINSTNEKAWNECMGQDNSEEFIVNIKNREYQLKGSVASGHQTYKRVHDELQLCIPIYLGIKDGNSIPLNNNFNISVKATLTKLENITCFKDKPEEKTRKLKKVKKKEEPSKPVVICEIESCEFYTTHKFIDESNWVFTIFKWPTTYIKTYDTFSKHLRSPTGKCMFAIEGGVINNIYVAFRPIENFTNPKHWFCNQYVENQSQKILIDSDEQQLNWTNAQIPVKKDIIDTLELTIGDHNISHDAKSLSNYMAYKNNYNSKFGPWHVFSDMKYIDLYDNNRKMAIEYSSSISSTKQVKIIVIVEKLVELKVNGKEIFNAMGITDEDFYL